MTEIVRAGPLTPAAHKTSHQHGGSDLVQPTFSDIVGHGNWKLVYTNGSGVETELALGAAGTALVSAGASSAPSFVKQVPIVAIVRQAGGNYTTTSSTFVVIDGTNLAITMTLAIGDVVELILMGHTYNSSNNVGFFDFQITEPDTTVVRACNSSDHGATAVFGVNRVPLCVVAYFTATQAGSHTLKPVWLANAGTQTLPNSASSGADQSAVVFSAKNLRQ